MRTHGKRLAAVIWILALLTLPGCSDDGDGQSGADGGGLVSRDGGGSGADWRGGGQSGLGDNLPATTGDSLADALIKAALSCGYQSFNTVPPGWKMTLLGEQGCAAWAPASWTASGAGTNLVSIEGGNTGFAALMGVPHPSLGVSCTPRGATTFLKWVLEQSGCAGVKERYYKAGSETVAGVTVQKADVVLSCSSGAVQKVGYFWSSVQSTSPLCNLLILGFWVPGGQIQSQTCTATQVLQSMRCPQPGGKMCVDAECAADCQKAGASGGQCSQNDTCVCS